MGNNASLPEKLYQAVQKNDVCAFQALVRDFGSGLDDPDARAQVLEHKDRNGRTPLLLAAAKNHYQIMQELITLGADVHYVNPTPGSAGAALHEAASRRHEAAVELLLAAGANPFAANCAGRTALDEAVLSGHTGVVRAIERRAEFTGAVAFKTRAMAGLTSKYKVRWAVLMPYYPFRRGAAAAGGAAAGPTGNSPSPASAGATGASSGGGAPPPPPPPAAAAGKPRRCLWLYKDQTSISPRCRLWLDGAAVVTHGPAGTEGTLRLHTSHAEPAGDLATSFSRGYCVAMRPADLTPAAAAVYHRLVSLINTPPTGAGTGTGPADSRPASASQLPQPQGQRPAPPASSPPPPPGALPASAAAPAAAMSVPVGGPPPPAGQWPANPPVYPSPPPSSPPPAPPAPAGTLYPAILPAELAHMSPRAQARPAPPPPPPPPQAPAPAPAAPGYAAYPGAAGPCPMALPLTLYQQQQAVVAAMQASAAAAVAAASAAGAAFPSSSPAPHSHSHSPERASGSRPSAGRPPLPDRPHEPAAGGCGRAGAGSGGQEVLVGTGGEVIGETFIETMRALPGESDEDFAARLASAVSATSGRSQQHLYPQQPASRQANSVAGAPSAASGGGMGSSASSGNLINFQSDPGSVLPASGPSSGHAHTHIAGGRPVGHYSSGTSTPHAAHGTASAPAPGGGNQLHYAAATRPAQGPPDGDLDLDAVNALIAAEARAQWHHAPGGGQPAVPTWHPASPPPAKHEAPSAPPAGAFASPPHHSAQQGRRRGGGSEPEGEADCCVICLSAPKEVGLLHGDTVHRCVCRGCSAALWVGSPCPLCRQTVERVLGVY